jgi:hypothetical protein
MKKQPPMSMASASTTIKTMISALFVAGLGCGIGVSCGGVGIEGGCGIGPEGTA